MMSSLNDISLELASALLTESDSGSRAALLAAAAVEALPDSACILYRYGAENGEGIWTAVGMAGEVSVEQATLAGTSRLFAPLLTEAPTIHIHTGQEIRREDYAHLHVTRSVASIAYLPLHQDGKMTGALEMIAFSRELRRSDLIPLDPIVCLASPAVLSAEEFERQRHDLLASVYRMTQLYDLEKSLNASLDLDKVIALVPQKTFAMLSCQAIHLWLFDGDELRLMSTSGQDETVQTGTTQAPGEGYVADMAEEGEVVLISDAEDERLAIRNSAADAEGNTTPIYTALLAPLMQDEQEVGVLEAVNKTGGTAFDEDDQFFLTSIAETVSSALKNASLLFAERKLEILEALVHVSSEITSTLRLNRLLQIVVNSPQNVLPFERCSIALDNRGRLQLKAISGMANIPLGDVQVEGLHRLLAWLSTQTEVLHLRQDEDGSQRNGAPDLPDPVARHFETTGYRALYSLPLSDDQGRLGLLLYESSDPDFLDLPHTEMIKILAGQSTVAIRNALLYREVPLISLLEPLVQTKQSIMRSSRRRRLGFAAVAIAAILFLIFCPLPMRIAGGASVAPQHLVTITAPLDGTVAAVFAHEGQQVAAGDVLGAMNDWQWRTDLATAEASYREAVLTMEADLASGSTQSGADRSQVEYLRSRLARARNRIDSGQLRSPITGVVVTPYLRNAAGEHLDAGAAFAQVLDLSSAVVDIAIPQQDASLIQLGQSTAIKLESYPQRSWHGRVTVVSPEAEPGDGERTFVARVLLPNNDGILRAGMAGRAKVFVGFRPAGYVLLRAPALWLWKTLWNWIGW